MLAQAAKRSAKTSLLLASSRRPPELGCALPGDRADPRGPQHRPRVHQNRPWARPRRWADASGWSQVTEPESAGAVDAYHALLVARQLRPCAFDTQDRDCSNQ
jgi:hypothetical protein